MPSFPEQLTKQPEEEESLLYKQEEGCLIVLYYMYREEEGQRGCVSFRLRLDVLLPESGEGKRRVCVWELVV